MKTKYIAILATLAATGLGMAQTAYTTPVGYVTIPLPGKATPTSPNRLQVASQQLLPPGSTEFAGVIDSIATSGLGSLITDAAGTWAANSFVLPAPVLGTTNSHLVEITSGPLTGTFTWITASATGTLTTFDNINAAGTASYRVVKAFTVSSMFGSPPAATALGTGTSATSADNLQLFNSPTNTYTTFYYRLGAATGGDGWRTTASSSVNVANVAIHPSNSGLVILRKQVGDGSLVISGNVKTGVTDVLIRGKGGTGPTTTTLNIVQALIPVDQLKLGTSGLYTGSSATGVLAGTSATAADNVLFFNAATNSYTTYYYRLGAATGGDGWRSSSSSSTDQSNVLLPSTSAILIQRKGASATDFTWEIPSAIVGP